MGYGYKVKTTLSGQNAIDLITKNKHEPEKIVLVLMDCQMPVMDAYETTRILRKMMLDKRIPKILIVALSANDNEMDKEMYKKVAMVDHLGKTLKDVELGRTLKRYL